MTTTHASQTPGRFRSPQAVARSKLILLTIAGLIVGGLLLIVVFNIDSKVPEDAETKPPEWATSSLAVPGPLTEQDLNAGAASPEAAPQLIGAERAWIETADGKLYRFSSLEPLPNGWSKMTQPQVRAFLSGDRVLTMTSDSAVTYMPARTPLSGSMSGNVLIRMYEMPPGKAFDADTMTPSLEIKTDGASFDNALGEIRCDDWVDIQSPAVHLPGSGLRIQINEVERKPQWLEIEQVAAIRLRQKPGSTSLATSTNQPASKKPGAPSADRQTSTPTTAPVPDPRFYRLTFRKNVTLTQGDPSAGSWTALGDELGVTFSLDSSGLSDVFGEERPETGRHLRHEPLQFRSGPAQSVPELLATISIALVDQPAATRPEGLFKPSDDDIIITCDGGLSLAPLVNAAERPNSIDDARFELVGAPMRLSNQVERVDVLCSSMLYHTQAGRLLLSGTAEHPLQIDSPQLRATGERLWLSRGESRGGFEGPGWMVAAHDGGQPERPRSAPGTTSDDEIRIDWTQGVDLEFAEPAGNDTRSQSGLRLATFMQDVTVTSTELTLAADLLTVTFPTTPTDGVSAESKPADSAAVIESVVAKGSVRVDGVREGGYLAGDELTAAFSHDPNGRTAPSIIGLRGSVQAVDRDRQTMWADALDLTFAPRDETPASTTSNPGDSSVELETFLATGHVQVLLDDGSRAFGDKLEAASASQIVQLTGSHVIVISGQSIASRGTHLEIHQADSTATWHGPGVFEHYTNAIEVNRLDNSIDRESLAHVDAALNPLLMRATWDDSMRYDGRANGGAGSVALLGRAHAESTPNPLELNTVDADALTLQFANRPRPSATQPASSQPRTSEGAGFLGSDEASRMLKTFVAEGNARIERRAWLTADHGDPPRLFYIAGPKVTYDDELFEASVEGAGQLLTSDPRPAAGAQDNTAGLSSRGTTLFSWTQGLHMTQRSETEREIVMTSGVQIRHSPAEGAVGGADGGQITKLAADELRAVLTRDAGAAGRPGGSATALNIGGAILRRITGTGAVYIDTPARDIDCDEFDIDYGTNIARLIARDQRVVTLKADGKPDMVQAKAVQWDLLADVITVTESVGAVSR